MEAVKRFLMLMLCFLLPAMCLARQQHGSQLSLRAAHHQVHAKEVHSKLSLRAGHHQVHAKEVHSKLSLRAGHHQVHVEEVHSKFPTPAACSADSRRYVGDHMKDQPKNLPNKPSCAGKLEPNWVFCPSRSRNFAECSYYCPSLHFTTYTRPTAKDKCAAGTGVQSVKKLWAHTTAQNVCVQLDVNTFGNLAGFNFGVGVTATLDDKGLLVFEGMIGGGLTIGAVVLKASGYIQGDVRMAVQLPVSERNLYQGIKWSITQLYEWLKQKTPLGRFVNWVKKKTGRKTALESLTQMREKESQANSLARYREQKPGSWVPFSCSESKRGGNAQATPALFPPKSVAGATCDVKLKPGWVKCPSRTREFKKCSYYCPKDGKTLQTVPTTPCTGLGSKFEQTDADRTYGKIIREDALQKRNIFLHKYADAAQDILKMKGFNENTYTERVRVLWREVYLDQTYEKQKGWSNWLKEKIGKSVDCAKLNADGKSPIKPIFCVFMKVGWLLANPKQGEKIDNLKEMIPMVYPELFPKGVDANGEDTDTLDMNRVKALLKSPYKSEVAYKNFYVTGISSLLSYPAADLSTVLEALAAPKEKAEACNKGILSFEGQLTFAFTAGASNVGFCTPDTNAIQISSTKTWTLLKVPVKDPAGRKKAIQNADSIWKSLKAHSKDKLLGTCTYEWQKSEGWSTTVTFAASIYAALSITKFWNPSPQDKFPFDVQFRFRIDMDITDNIEPSNDDSNSPNKIIKWVENKILKFNGGGKDQGTFAAKGEGHIKDFFANIFKDLRATTAGSPGGIIGSIHSGLAKATGAKAMITGLLKKVVSELSPVTTTQLVGFDITRKRGGVWELTLVSHKYTSVGGSIPTGPGVYINVNGYEGSETRFEFSFQGY